MPTGYDYYALRNLYIGYTLAFNVGALVPDATVTAQGWIVGTDVQAVGSVPVTPQLLFYYGNPTDQQVPIWNAATSEWVPGNQSGGGGSGSGFATKLSSPTGTSADTTTIQAAITALGSNPGTIELSVGTWGLSGALTIPNTVNLVGQGGGSTSSAGQTILKCLNASAQLVFNGGGSLSGKFMVDGNSTATTPFSRQGGTGANARTFHNITVKNNAAGANDLALFYGAQNDLWYQCGFANAARDMAVFDQGYGGANFLRCEWTQNAGRYYHRFDNQVSGGVYAVPTDITFDKGIMEQGTTVTSLAYLSQAQLVTYSDYVFVVGSSASAELVSVQNGANGIQLHNPYFQSTANTTPVSGTAAIKVWGAGDVTITGRAWYENFDFAHSCDGVTAFIYDQSHASFFHCNQAFVGTNSASYLQVANLVNGIRQLAYAPGTIVGVHYNASRTAFQYEKDANGDERLFPGTGFGSPDVIVGRAGPGVYGVKSAGYMLNTGYGVVGSRASTPAGGALYGNTTTGKLDWFDGSAWHEGGKESWSKYLDLRSTPITISTGTWTSITTCGSQSVGSGATAFNAQWVTDLAAGTWTFDVVSLPLSNAGIVAYDYSLDGGTTWVNLATGVDLYATTTTTLKINRITGIAITTPGKLLFRVSGAGTKNASSSAYYATMVAFQAQRTA